MSSQDKRVFVGGLDRDSDYRLIKNGDYYYGLNIRNISSENQGAGSVESVLGNSIVYKSGSSTSFTYPELQAAGINQRSYLYFTYAQLTSSQALSNSVNFQFDMSLGTSSSSFSPPNFSFSFTSTAGSNFLQTNNILTGLLAFVNTYGTIISNTYGFTVSVVSNNPTSTTPAPYYDEEYVNDFDGNDTVPLYALKFVANTDGTELFTSVETGTYIPNVSPGAGNVNTLSFYLIDRNNLQNYLSGWWQTAQYAAESTGSTKINYKCIGSYEDTKNDKMYYFVASEPGTFMHHILEYDLKQDSQNGDSILSVVFRDTGKHFSRVFDWNFDFLITNIDKIGDVLYWTQEFYGEPCSLNVVKSKNSMALVDSVGAYEIQTSNNVTGYTLDKYYPYQLYSPWSSTDRKLEYVEVIKRGPQYMPTYSYGLDDSYKKNNLFGYMFQFKYRYHYYDKEVSAWSPISKVVASQALVDTNNLEADESQLQYTDNKIDVKVKNGSGIVQYIEVAAKKCVSVGAVSKRGNTGNFMSIAKIDNNYNEWLNNENSTQTVSFYNDRMYIFIDQIEGDKLYDSVPRTAKTQTVLGNNRLCYANYKLGFDLPKLDVVLNPKYRNSGGETIQERFPYFTTGRWSNSLTNSLNLSYGSGYSAYTSSNIESLTPWDLTQVVEDSNVGSEYTAGAYGLIDTVINSTATDNDNVLNPAPFVLPVSGVFTEATGTGVTQNPLSSGHYTGAFEITSDYANQFPRIRLSFDLAGDNTISAFAGATINLNISIDGFFVRQEVVGKENDDGSWVEFDAQDSNLHEGSYSVSISIPPELNTLGGQMQYFAEQLVSGDNGLEVFTSSTISDKPEGVFAWYGTPVFTESSSGGAGKLHVELIMKDKVSFDGPDVSVIGDNNPKYRYVARSGNFVSTVSEGQYSWSNPYVKSAGYSFVMNHRGGSCSLKYTGSSADSPTGTFKSGAFHSFGLIYYDARGRASTVAVDDDTQVYIKSYAERGDTSEQAIPGDYDLFGPSQIDWEIHHKAPSWAKYYRWAYSLNTTVDDFIQFVAADVYVNTTDDNDRRIYLSLASLKGTDRSYRENRGALIDYVGGRGRDEADGEGIVAKDPNNDRIRFIKDRDGVYFTQYIDTKLSGYDWFSDTDTESPIYGTDTDETGDAPTGYYIYFNEIDADGFRKSDVEDGTSYYKRILFEIYQPKKDPTADSRVFYEFGELHDVSSTGKHIGPNGVNGGSENTDDFGNITWDNAAKGSFENMGDVYYKRRRMPQTTESLVIQWLTNQNNNLLGQFVEDYNLSDFYETNHVSIGRLNLYSPFARETRRIAKITWSEKFQPETNYNGLSTFNTAYMNSKSMSQIDGSIQKIFARDTDLVVIHEDKTYQVPVDKDVIVNASGTDNQMGLSRNVLGNPRAYWGHFGISRNPESFVANGNVCYWVDIKRGAVLRLSRDGFTVLSDLKMMDYFRDKSVLYDKYDPEYGLYDDNNPFADGNSLFRIISGYNPKHNELVVTFPNISHNEATSILYDNWEDVSTNWNSAGDTIGGNTFDNITGETVAFAEKANRWTTFFNFIPEMYGKVNNNFFSFKGSDGNLSGVTSGPLNTELGTPQGGHLWKHDSGNYNQFYNGLTADNKFALSVPFNSSPSTIKTFKSLSIEGSSCSATLSTDIVTSSVSINSGAWDERENIQYASVPYASDQSGTDSSEYKGLGTCTLSGATLTGSDTMFLSEPIQVGYNVYRNISGTDTLVGVIGSIDSDLQITLTSSPGNFSGQFCFARFSNSNVGVVDGTRIKGSYMKFEMSDTGTSKKEIFAVNAIVQRSDLSDR